jgi:hypothetical protein
MNVHTNLFNAVAFEEASKCYEGDRVGSGA